MNEIQLYDNLSAVEKAGALFAKSGMFGCERVEQGFVLAMICAWERKSPTELLRTYHIIDGKLSKKALAALAEFRARGGRHKWLKTGDDGVAANGEFTFEGSSITVGYSIDEAKRAGVWRAKSAWERQPGNMLRARCISNAVGMLAPEIYAGDEMDEAIASKPALDLGAVIDVPIVEPKLVPPVEASDAAIESATALAPAMNPNQRVAVGPKEFPVNLRPDHINEPIKPETLTKLEAAIGDIADQALVFLRSDQTPDKGPWIGPNDGFEHIAEREAQRILSNVGGFRARAAK